MTGEIMIPLILETKFGNVKLNDDGYYIITSRKEGNNGKIFHRLVWEDWYGIQVPKGYVIHHLNGDKLDNRIQNLQCVEIKKHISYHHKGLKHSEETKEKIKKNRRDTSGKNNYMYGKHHSYDTCIKMSKNQNSSGYYNVTKKYNPNYKQGFIWRYRYYENGKRKQISNTNIKNLEEEVKKRGLKWEQF